MTVQPSGYSGKSLADKLGIKAGHAVFVMGAPKPYAELLSKVPEGITFVRQASRAHLIHLFVTERQALQAHLKELRHSMPADTALWVSWPKRASKMPTDITEDVIRTVCLPLGLVDIKVCAVDATWSGLKLMIRKELRGATAAAQPAQRSSLPKRKTAARTKD
jgi:hypothetical protein